MMHTIGIGRKALDLEVNGQEYCIRFVSVYARKRAGDLFDAISRISAGEDLTEDEARGVLAAREECLENLLESNGYKFDSAWWEKNTGYEEQNEFVYMCMMKDLSGEGSKKKA